MYLQDTLDILMHPLHWYLYCISCPHCLTKFPLLQHEEKKIFWYTATWDSDLSSFQVWCSWGSQERWRWQESKVALQGSLSGTSTCAAVSRSLAAVLLSKEALLHVQKGKQSQTCQCSVTSAFLSTLKTPTYCYSIFYIVLFLYFMCFLLKGQFTIFLYCNREKMWS